MSLRIKIVFSFLLTQFITLSVIIWMGMDVMVTSHFVELERKVVTLADTISASSQNAIIAGDIGSLESTVNQVVKNEGIAYIRIKSNDEWSVMAGEKSLLEKERQVDIDINIITDGIFDYKSDVMVEGRKYGEVEVGLDIHELTQSINTARNSSITSAIFSGFVMLLISLVLGGYLARSMKKLAQLAEKVSNGDLSVRMDVSGNDEIAKTAKAFNLMAEKLKASDEQRKTAELGILELNRNLEDRVNKRTEELQVLNVELKYQSLHDALTKLPNRLLFTDRLIQAIKIATRDKKSFTVLTMDLDRFKAVNDSLGHQMGDLVLQAAAQRTLNVLRASDTVARMGGDEFSVLMPTACDEAGAVVASSKIVNAISEPIMYQGHKFNIGASIGIAMFPTHGDDVVSLMKRSDAAMYSAKRAGGGYAVYNQSMEKIEDAKLFSKIELKEGIDEDQLVLFFQPKIDIDTAKVIGVEALVRWQHPQKGLIYPDQFIPVAERGGMMKLLTMKVLEIAFKQMKEWELAGLSIQVAINISTINLQDIEFADEIRNLAGKYKIDTALVELEVTETAIMSDPIKAIQNIKILSEMGIQISIDDFGTGYSSMAYLKKLLVAKLKIDKSFVMDMTKVAYDRVIVKSTVDLGHNLGLKVIAEGVEDLETWKILKEMGCDSAQGYFMSRPMPSEKLLEWVKGANFSRLNDSA